MCRQEEGRVGLALGQGEQVLTQLARHLPLCPLYIPPELPQQHHRQLQGLPEMLTQLTGARIRLPHFWSGPTSGLPHAPPRSTCRSISCRRRSGVSGTVISSSSPRVR